MNRDGFRGAKRHLKGRAQSALGGIAGDAGCQVRGAVDQIAGGAHDAYGRACGRAEDVIGDGMHLARRAHHRGETYGRRALGHADENPVATLFTLAAVAFAAG